MGSAKFTGRAAVLLLVLAVLAVSYASSTRAWLRQRGEINQLGADIAAQRHDIAKLRQEKHRLHDPAYIRIEARTRFGWVMPGETGYRVIGDDGEVITDSSSSLSKPVASGTAEPEDWWDEAWGSVEAAGSEPDAPTADEPADKGGAPPAGHIGRDGRETDDANNPDSTPGDGGAGTREGGGQDGAGGR